MTPRERESSTKTALIITCEHGGNRVPTPYRKLFRNSQDLLNSHRGFDLGALPMAKAFARHFDAPLLTSTVSRLLVDLNRSIGHRNLHMETIQNLPEEIRDEIIEHYYRPYRRDAERLVSQGIAQSGRVVHVSCHSFTDSLDGVVRQADVGLLYDPARLRESELCAEWKSVLRVHAPGLTVRRNYPYEGRDDGLTTTLRKKFTPPVYLGIELELNQKNLLAPEDQWSELRESIITSFDKTLRNNDL